MKKYKEKMPPPKKMAKPAKRVKQRLYDEDKEKHDDAVEVREGRKFTPKPRGIAQAMDQAKEGYSKKPRVIPSKKRSR